ncbi:MAG TPA: HYR domain-containing protein [Thermoanaerobaculia bacterium]|nr:HYR domain-containing protein [Thermoanaerobaculia bacterium]
MTASGTGFSETDTFVFTNGVGARFDVTVSSLDRATGAITGWVPLGVVNTGGSWLLTVQSQDGESAPVKFSVYKPGRLPLQLHLPEAIAVLARGISGTGIKYDVQVSGGDGTVPTVNCEPATGSLFPIGTTRIYCTAYDTSYKDESVTFVNVWDGTPPSLTIPAGFDVPADDTTGAYVKFDTSATDAIDGALRVTCDHDSGTLFPNGRTTVNCEAADNSLNYARGAFDVFVKPRDPGVLQLKVPDDIKVEATDSEGTNVDYDVVAYGSADPDPVVECYPASGSYFRIGYTKVSCTATDDFGARADAGFVVSVVRGAFLQGQDMIVEATSPSGAEVTWDITPDETWNASIACSPASGSLFGFGETEVTCSSTDAAGEPVKGKFKVTVSDTTAPHIENVRATVGALESNVSAVKVEVETIDAGDAAPRCTVSTLTSETSVEWNRTSELALEIRGGAPRSFRVEVTCTDASGNSSTTSIPAGAEKGLPAKVQ